MEFWLLRFITGIGLPPFGNLLEVMVSRCENLKNLKCPLAVMNMFSKENSDHGKKPSSL
jgi:hypothetical protein